MIPPGIGGNVCAEARAKEVFLYAPTPDYDRVYIQGPNGALTPTTDLPDDGLMDRGLGNALVQAAVDAGKIDDLRARLEARAAQPLAELPARSNLARHACHASQGSKPRIKISFTTLSDRLKKDSLQKATATRRIAGVLIPALGDPGYAKAGNSHPRQGGRKTTSPVATSRPLPSFASSWRMNSFSGREGLEPPARALSIKLIEAAEKKSGSQVFDVHLALANE